jgi:hypothetical protein
MSAIRAAPARRHRLEIMTGQPVMKIIVARELMGREPRVLTRGVRAIALADRTTK